MAILMGKLEGLLSEPPYRERHDGLDGMEDELDDIEDDLKESGRDEGLKDKENDFNAPH